LVKNEVPGKKGEKEKGRNNNSRKAGNNYNRNNSGSNTKGRGAKPSENSENFNDKRNKKQRVKSNYSQKPRYNKNIRAEETIDDIKVDITRIEKEIQLEIKEIRSLKLGL